MTNKERGNYIEKYVIWNKKRLGEQHYKRYYLFHKLGMMYVLYEKDFGADYFIYEEWFRMWNPLIWIIIVLRLPFIIIMNGINCFGEIINEIKEMFKVDSRVQLRKERFNEFMEKYYPTKIKEFYDFDLDKSTK